MTNQEAIEIIKCAIAEVEWNYPLDYAAAFEMAIKALEKQIPKFVECPKGWQGTRYTRYYCPNCNKILRMDEKWCGRCGQHLKQPKKKLVDNRFELDWSEEE